LSRPPLQRAISTFVRNSPKFSPIRFFFILRVAMFLSKISICSNQRASKGGHHVIGVATGDCLAHRLFDQIEEPSGTVADKRIEYIGT